MDLHNYECHNEAQSQNDKCIFHDQAFPKRGGNRQLLEKNFQDFIDDGLLDNHAIFCIGYCLNDINMQACEILNSVYFNEANVTGTVNINSKFSGSVSFSKTSFSGKGYVSFSKANFLETVA